MLGEFLIHVRAWDLLRQLRRKQLCDLRRQVLAQEGPRKLRPAHELLEESVVAVGWWIWHKGESYAGDKSKTNNVEIENQWIL
jgi:hypothetical protein